MKLVKYLIATLILLSCISQSVLAKTTSDTRTIDFELKNKSNKKILLQIHYYSPEKRERHYKQEIGIDPGKTLEENQIKIGKDGRILLRIFVGYFGYETEKDIHEIIVTESKKTVYLSYRRLDGISTQKGTGLPGSKKTTSGKSLKNNIGYKNISKNLTDLRASAQRLNLSFLKLMTNKENKDYTIRTINEAFNKTSIESSEKKYKQANLDRNLLIKYFKN